MSSSPLPSDSRNPTRPPQVNHERLNLSQALIITAGLAGLIGLGSGAVIRFSLATSSNTRFLSPMQTFPALPNWAPELPQGTADSHYLPGGAESGRTGEYNSTPPLSDRNASIDSRSIPAVDAVESPAALLLKQSSAASDISSFDAFAARNEPIKSLPDPRETLGKGPSIGTSSPYSIDSMEKSSAPVTVDENSNEGFSDQPAESDSYSPDYWAPEYPAVAEPDYSDGAGYNGYENNGQW